MQNHCQQCGKDDLPLNQQSGLCVRCAIDNEQTEIRRGIMNAPSTIPGILDWYCWEHTPGGWDCPMCWAQIHLTNFFEAVAIIASVKVWWLITDAIKADREVAE